MRYRDERGRFISRQKFEQDERRRRFAAMGMAIMLLVLTVLVFLLKF